MTIDNGTTSIKWTLAEIITFVAPIALMLYSKFHNTSYGICFGIAAVVLLAHIIILLINPSYVYYSDEGKHITIRHVTAYPFFRKYPEYTFPKTSFKAYSIKNQFFGLKKILTLTISGLDPNTKKAKTIEVNNINISSLDKKSIENLKRSLDFFVNK